MYAGASPTSIVMTVDATACHTVNQATSHVAPRLSVSATVLPLIARASNVAKGQR